MRSAKRSKNKDKRRLYIMRFVLPECDEVVYKIGVTSGGSAKLRLLEIIGSYFDKYRLTPVVKIVRDRAVTDSVFMREKILHAMFSDCSYKPNKKFSGSTEFFIGVDEVKLIKEYERVVKLAKGELNV